MMPTLELSVNRVFQVVVAAAIIGIFTMFYSDHRRYDHDMTVLQGTFNVTQVQYIEINRRLAEHSVRLDKIEQGQQQTLQELPPIRTAASDRSTLAEVQALRAQLRQVQADLKRVYEHLSPNR